ncbi:SWIM zinc finger [Microlunatus sagamiharensis]|uniref:SWIM zinc finger n=1 Tax=Microlunatus sagamiharensis TaxID=546874 RepID=A0A1H2MEP6_9ACTN|nr:SWIM zinc finger [Microlunatus sagamiharensis]
MALTTVSGVEVWTRGQVVASAPDDASRRAALPLVSSRVWSESGRGGPLLWGRCRGSATYAVVVAPGPAPALSATCTCPSRKSPCKHALALLLRWADGLLPPGERPGWAQVPATADGPGTGDADRVPDAAAAAARAAERRAKVAAGLDELDRWLLDQVRTGLSAWERQPWARVEGVAARMVDAQAPGVAGLLRGLPGLLARTDQSAWPARLLEALAGLHLLVLAHRGLDALPADLAATVRSRIGYPVARAAVLDGLGGPSVADRWSALGAVDSLEGRLESRRVWLWGSASRRWALLLSFAVPGSGLDDSVAVGQVLDATAHRYPGAAEHRVLLEERREADDTSPDWPQAGVVETQRAWAAQLAADPWSTRMPAVLRAVPVVPTRPGEPWHLADADGTAVRLLPGATEPWPLLAASGGRPVDVFGEWGPSGFLAVRVLQPGSALAAPRLLEVA